jgi:hypothetical protein
MPDAKISELPAAAALSEFDITPVVQGQLPFAETRQATLPQLRAGVLADRALHVRDFGAVGDGVTDDTAAIQAAINAASTRGGGIVLLGPRRYVINSAELVVKNGVFLRGRSGMGGFRPSSDYSTVVHALLVNPAFTVRVQRNAGLEGLAVLRLGLGTPMNLRQGLDAAAAFAGTGVTIGDGSSGSGAGNGADTLLSRLFILGFNWGIYSDGNARVRIENILGDATNGLYFGRSFDVSRISEVNWHPLVTTARSWSNTRIVVTAVGNNGSGRFRLTLASPHSLQNGDVVNVADVRNSGASSCYGRWVVTVVDSTRIDLNDSTYVAGWTSGGAVYINPNRRAGVGFTVRDCDMAAFENCFEYGHEIGYDVQDAVHTCTFVNVGTDGWVDAADPQTIGVRISGTALSTKWIGGFLSSKGCSLQLAATGSEQHQVIGVNVTGGARRCVEVLDGQLSMTGCDFTGSVGTGNATISAIHMGDSAGTVIVSGCDTGGITFTADNAAAMQRLQLLGNRMGGSNANTHRISGGRVELASVGSGAAIETRLSSDTDGVVNIHRRSSGTGAQLRLHGGADTPFVTLSLNGSECNFAGVAASNANPVFSMGGSGMTAAQTLKLRRISASPLANDRLSILENSGMNSAGVEKVFARLVTTAESIVSGNEGGAVVVETSSAGTVAERFRIAANGTVTLTGPMVLPANPVANLQAAPKQYVDSQFTDRRLTTLITAAATTVSHASHNNRMLIANAGTTLSLSWTNTGDGFSCTVVNRTGADLAMTLSGFTTNTAPTNSDGYTRIRAGGVATLLVYSPDGGTTRICQLAGAGAP